PRGLGGRARGAQGVRALLRRQGRQRRPAPALRLDGPIDLMAEYVDPVRSSRRRRPFQTRLEDRPLLMRLDWLLFGAAVALVVFGLWAVDGITRYDVPGATDYFLVR